MCIPLESDLQQLQFCGYPSYLDSVNYLMRCPDPNRLGEHPKNPLAFAPWAQTALKTRSASIPKASFLPQGWPGHPASQSGRGIEKTLFTSTKSWYPNLPMGRVLRKSILPLTKTPSST